MRGYSIRIDSDETTNLPRYLWLLWPASLPISKVLRGSEFSAVLCVSQSRYPNVPAREVYMTTLNTNRDEIDNNYQLFYKMQKKALTEFSQRLDTAERGGKKIVLLYQMGKVGSRSLDYSLKNNNETEVEVFHLHRMLPSSNLSHILKAVCNGNIPQAVTYRCWMEIFEKIILKKTKVYIISGVREPIARNISAFFQNAKLTDSQLRETNSVIDLFFDTYPHDTPLTWFDLQFQQPLGIDVYQYPFDKESGCVEFSVDNCEVMIISAEKVNREKEEHVTKFLKLREFKIINRNAASEKPYADAYREFKKKIRFPASYIEKMLDSKYAKHFFDQGFITLTKNLYAVESDEHE